MLASPIIHTAPALLHLHIPSAPPVATVHWLAEQTKTKAKAMPSRTPLVPSTSSVPLLLITILYSAAASHAVTACDPADRAALLRVKAQLGDPAGLSSWRASSANCCAWDPGAVACGGASSGRVTALALCSLPDVSARVPAALGDLSALEILQIVSVPGLSGPFPASFAGLTRLRDVNVNGTSISGAVPASLLAGAANLSTLVIANSKLAGPIPASLSSFFPNLRYLDLSGNLLTGAIPPGLLLHGSFRFLLLSNNRLTGEIPSGYGDADGEGLYAVDLSRNQLGGDPSRFLFGITKGTARIDLSWNALEFDMTGVEFPHHLRFLDLSHNRITGSVAKSLRDVRLEHFDVSYNQLCGEIPAGRFMAAHGAECYEHNRCLCGAPLPPCNTTV